MYNQLGKEVSIGKSYNLKIIFYMNSPDYLVPTPTPRRYKNHKYTQKTPKN